MISSGQLGHHTSDLSRAEDKNPKKIKIPDKVTFFEADLDGMKCRHDYLVVVSLNITNYDVH